MSTGGSFWHRLRMRLGGSDAMLAQLSDLIQKQIDANADVQEVTEEAILNPIIISPSKMVLRDNLFRVVNNTVAEGLNNLLPIDPDLDLMRLWVKNDHGGRYLTDYSFMGSRVQLNGGDQSKLIFSTVDDQVDNSSIVNQFRDDQYIRVEDKDKNPNPNVRIKEIAATAEGISVFIRIYVQRNDNEADFGKPGVLFSKIDTEQVDYAYGAYLKSDGSVFFFVREAGREYSITTAPAALVYTQANLPDYTDTDYKPSDYHTVETIDVVPTPIPFADLTFTYTFATKRMQIYKSIVNTTPTVIADSNSNPEASGLVGWWRLNEGGDIGNTPDAPASYARTIYNSVAAGNNGLITNATWDTNNYLNFDGNNDLADVTNYTAIQNLSAFTVSFWYYPKATPSTDGYIVRKGTVLSANSWLVYHLTGNIMRFSIWNNATTRFDVSKTTAFPTLNTWYHIVAKVTLAAKNKIFVNNVETQSAGNVTGTLDTGATVLRLGGTTTANTPTGLVHDLKIWNRELSNAEITTLYNAGHQTAYLPSWQANPPLVPGPPGPITNPFVSVYLAPAAGGVPTAGEQDLVRLHAITASSLTERYNVGQGAQQTPSAIPDDPQYYDNDPAYDSGTAVQETLSTYAESSRTAVSAQYLKANFVTFVGQRFLTGSDVIGRPVTKVVAKMADVNSSVTPATGNIVAKIVKASDGTVPTGGISNNVDVSTVTNNQGGTNTANWSNHTFTFTGLSYLMANNDKIQFEYDQGGTAPEAVSDYSQLGATLTAGAYAALSKTYIHGQKFLTGSGVIGSAITKIVTKMADINSASNAATGNVVAKIYSGSTHKATSDAVDASTLADNPTANTTSWTTKTFTFAGNAYPMATGDRVQFEFDEGGTTGAPTETLSGYAQQNATESTMAGSDQDTLVAQALMNSSSDLHGKIISKVVIKLADMDNGGVGATANCICRIRRGTDDIVQISSNTISASTLASYPSKTVCTFTFTNNTYVMNGSQSDYISIEHGYAGGGSNTPSVGVTVTSGTAEPNTELFIFSSSWTEYSQYDVAMDVYTQTAGTSKLIGIPTVTSTAEANTNLVQAQWSAPSTFSDVSGDMVMDVYVGSANNAKAIGIAYSTTAAKASSNAYDAPWSTGTVADKSTFDLGIDVYIDTKTGTANHQYHPLQNAGSKFAALYISSGSAGLVAKQPTKFTFRVNKVGAPTGSLFCRIKKGSDGTTITFPLTQPVSAASIDVSTLTTASTPATLYTFELDSNGQTGGYALQSGDRVMLELSGGTSSGSAYVQVARTHTTSRVANVNMQISNDGTTWTSPNSSLDDTIGVVYVGGYTPPPIFPYHTLGYGNTRITQKVTSTTASAGNLYNQIITQVKPWLKRIGSPTGLINVVVRSAADAQVASINTLDASSVDNVSFTQYTFTNLNNTYTMALNDRICVEFSGGDVNNHIQCNTNLLDTYPYGMLETYAGTSYTSQLLHDLAGNMSSGGGATDPLARTRVGEKVATTNSTIKLKKISRITVYMKRTVSPTGNVTFRIRNSADAVVATLGTLAAGTIDPNTPTAYTITSSPISSYALQVGDHVSVEYNAGDDANFVEIMTSKTTDLFGGTTNTYLSKYNDINWVPNTAIDLVGQMWEGGETFTPSQEDVVIPDPKYTKDLIVLGGGSPWTWVNHDLLSSTYPVAQLFVNAIMPEFRLYRKVLTLTEITNINTNRLDRATIPLGQVSKFAYSFITED